MEHIDEQNWTRRLGLFGISIQHVLIALPMIVAVPAIFGAIVGLNPDELNRFTQSCIFLSGVVTIIHATAVKYFGMRTSLVFGIDATMIAIGLSSGTGVNLRTLFAAFLIGSIISALIGWNLIRHRIKLSPTIALPAMVIYCCSLLPAVSDWFLGGLGAADFGSMRNVFVGAAVVAFTLFLNQYGKGIIKSASVTLGMILGITISVPLGLIHLPDKLSLEAKLPAIFPYVPYYDNQTLMIALPIIMILLCKQLIDFRIYAEQSGAEDSEQAYLIGQGMVKNAIGYVLSFVLGCLPASAQSFNIGLNSLISVSRPKISIQVGIILIIAGLFPSVASLLMLLPLPVLGATGFLCVVALFNTVFQAARKVRWTQKEILVFTISLCTGLITILNQHNGYSIDQGIRILIDSGIFVSLGTGLFLDLALPDN